MEWTQSCVERARARRDCWNALGSSIGCTDSDRKRGRKRGAQKVCEDALLAARWQLHLESLRAADFVLPVGPSICRKPPAAAALTGATFAAAQRPGSKATI